MAVSAQTGVHTGKGIGAFITCACSHRMEALRLDEWCPNLSMRRMEKRYAYVDDTGQETAATFVLVAVVVAGDDRNILLHGLSAVEHATGKGKTPWHTSRHPARQASMDQVLNDAGFRRRVLYAVYPGTRSSHDLTRLTIAKALGEPSRGQPYRVTVMIDGLPHRAVRLVSVG